MREDMQKRKALAAKGKRGSGINDIEVEIAGATQVQDLLNESQENYPQDEGLMSTK